MAESKLLDCTLRDGGYVNDWEFGHENLVSIFDRLVASGVDIIEIGFLDERRPFDINRSIMPNTACAEKIWGNTTARPPMVVGMIDYGTCDISNLQPASESFLDGIRVIFKKHIMHEAMEFCAQVKALGYKVFSQLVSITAYDDDDLMELIDLVNEVKPYAVSMVDTYGLLHPNDLLQYYQLLDDHVVPEVQIGFHAHNNFQLAYANAIAFMNKEAKHDIVIDGTLFGMGKSAGNAPDELVAMYMNEHLGKSYDIPQMLEAIEESIMDFHTAAPWGYKEFFYLCASNSCHPDYVSFFKKKENLSVAKLYDILGKIEPEEKKLLYDAAVAERLYQDYIAENTDDESEIQSLEKELAGKKVLILGPGKTIKQQTSLVQDCIQELHPTVIAINCLPDGLPIDYLFVTKKHRYQSLINKLDQEDNKHIKVIATSNVESVSGDFDHCLNRAPLLELNEDINDNSFLMLLKILKKAGVKDILCAGLDGYSDTETNYFDPNMEYDFSRKILRGVNSHVHDEIEEYRKTINVKFITYSRYDEPVDIYAGTI